ncbi:MAG TPA: isochorismatase family protein [Mycobacteriales bacterium]|jgi:nicotinamidase-related amidase|nr:isochorismatase family protein [Mycobacteriales bacterium]
MPLDLAAVLAPPHTAVVTSECQNGVIGSESLLPELAAAAQASVIPNGARLLAAARRADVAVVHCVAGRRPDDRGSNRNARLFAATMRAPVRLDFGTPATQVVDEYAVAASDFVLSRIHGLNPMAGTDLDPILRNLGVATVVVVGVSVNVAITNLVMDAVNRGYQVVVPRDAVAGVPADYADAVIDNTLSLLATVTSTDDIVAAWGQAAS